MGLSLAFHYTYVEIRMCFNPSRVVNLAVPVAGRCWSGSIASRTGSCRGAKHLSGTAVFAGILADILPVCCAICPILRQPPPMMTQIKEFCCISVSNPCQNVPHDRED